MLANLYQQNDINVKMKRMYRRTLNKYEKAWDSNHTFTLSIVNNLSNLYANQDKRNETKKMYQRALDEKKKA